MDHPEGSSGLPEGRVREPSLRQLHGHQPPRADHQVRLRPRLRGLCPEVDRVLQVLDGVPWQVLVHSFQK